MVAVFCPCSTSVMFLEKVLPFQHASWVFDVKQHLGMDIEFDAGGACSDL